MSYGDYPDLGSVGKVLVVKLRHLGDTLLASPVFSLLKGRLGVRVDAYIYKDAYDCLEGHPDIDNFLFCDRNKKSFLDEIKTLQTIRKSGYDLVINLTEGDRGALAALFSKAKIRVGMDPGKSGFWGKRKIYTHLVKNCPTPRHSVEKNLDALRRIGLFPSEGEKELKFVLPLNVNLPFAEYILIHPVSRWRFKCYPQMGALAKELVFRGHKLVFTGGNAEYESAIINEIASGLPLGSFVNLAGQISLKELGYLIHRAKAVVTVDSVPLHIASALKASGAALFGPTSDFNWGPWQNPGMKVIASQISCRPCGQDGCGGSKFADCMSLINVDAVLNSLRYIINC